MKFFLEVGTTIQIFIFFCVIDLNDKSNYLLVLFVFAAAVIVVVSFLTPQTVIYDKVYYKLGATLQRILNIFKKKSKEVVVINKEAEVHISECVFLNNLMDKESKE